MEVLNPLIFADSRHRLLFISNEAEGLTYVDIGAQLSVAINSILHGKHLAMKTDEKLEEIIDQNTKTDLNIGDYVAIRNIGILFEPDLKINLHTKFDTWSKTRLLIVFLEGALQDNVYYLSSDKDPRYSINLKDITYKIK